MAQNSFDDRIAASYETRWPELFDPAVVDPAVDLLADLAGGGPALEFGVGTGRIAAPLARRGVGVHGIDLSAAMAARVPPDAGVELTIGDFAGTRVDGAFTLVYLLRNTITNLTTQDEQVDCFRNRPARPWVVDSELETYSTPHRFVWPGELDLMARLAGLALRERRAGWHLEPFTGDSRAHVSVWQKPSG